MRCCFAHLSRAVRSSSLLLIVALSLAASLSLAQQQRPTMAYYVIGHTQQQTDWQTLGEFDSKDDAIVSLKDNVSKGKRCNLVIVTVTKEQETGSTPILHGRAFLRIEDFE